MELHDQATLDDVDVDIHGSKRHEAIGKLRRKRKEYMIYGN